MEFNTVNMLEGQWSQALVSNNIKLIIRCLETLSKRGNNETLQIFSCWAQRTSESAKKELLTSCFSRCQGLWMSLDRNAFTRVHMLLQRLRNLLSLVFWARKHQYAVHLWHGVDIPCKICSKTNSCSDARLGCWCREHRTLNRYIWLGRLVQWWSIMGLLPKFPEPQEVKRISQMWKEMDLSHQKAPPETRGWEEDEMEKFDFLIEGMVLNLGKDYGCIWTSEDCAHKSYPPPSLQALLKLVLVPHTDTMSVQAILMYFILDVANFLQCKDDLLQSFCHAFTIPSNFSQQIRAFWLFDHGLIKTSMDLLLSPKATAPLLSWQHRCIINALLTKKQHNAALKYLQWAKPSTEKIEDAKLHAEVFLQSSRVSKAWPLLQKNHTEKRFFNDLSQMKEKDDAEQHPCPLSAKFYQHQRERAISSQDVIKLVKKSFSEIKQPQRSLRKIVWPQLSEKKSTCENPSLSGLSCLTPSSFPAEETVHPNDQDQEQPIDYEQSEKHEHITSSEDESSASSFTSASSNPLQQHPYVYKSTVTLQRISSLITDGDNQSGDEEEEESRTSSPAESHTECRELVWPPDGSTESVFLSTLDEESPEGNKSDERADLKDEDFSVAANVGTFRLNPFGKKKQPNQCSVSEYVLEMKVNLKEFDSHRHEPVQYPHQDSSNLSFKMSQDVFTGLNCEQILPFSSLNLMDQDRCVLPDSLNPDPTHNIQTTAESFDIDDNIPEKSEELQHPSPLFSWTHDKETTEYVDLLSAAEPGKKTLSPFQDQSYTYGLVSFMDFVSKQRDDKQAEKKEPEGWSGKAPQQGATRSGRTRMMKSKRAKRT